MNIVAFHRHAVTEARRHLKPSIPQQSAQGIPIASRAEADRSPAAASNKIRLPEPISPRLSGIIGRWAAVVIGTVN